MIMKSSSRRQRPGWLARALLPHDCDSREAVTMLIPFVLGMVVPVDAQTRDFFTRNRAGLKKLAIRVLTDLIARALDGKEPEDSHEQGLRYIVAEALARGEYQLVPTLVGKRGAPKALLKRFVAEFLVEERNSGKTAAQAHNAAAKQYGLTPHRVRQIARKATVRMNGGN
jgi:hypothetical protein